LPHREQAVRRHFLGQRAVAHEAQDVAKYPPFIKTIQLLEGLYTASRHRVDERELVDRGSEPAGATISHEVLRDPYFRPVETS
jgi:hypothetical protein